MRASGILLPVFSLPGRYGIGSFSEEARKFIDFLVEAGQTYWQILPIGPTSYGDSPYQSFSVFAGNPYFISLEELIRQGLLTEAECDALDFGTDRNDIDYGKLYEGRYKLLRLAFGRSDIEEDEKFQRFLVENDDWLPDYAMFMVLKNQNDGAAFHKWEDQFRLHNELTLIAAEEALHEELRFYEYLQYEFNRQWTELKKYANDSGIRIVGDIPIYVAPDSADVWAHPELFQVDEEGHMEAVAGCPPDGFSADGQLWGNPLYRWEYHASTGYEWWIRRMERCRQLYDVIRIDHFRGFDQYYSIPADAKTAKIGEWKDGPGMKLFDAISEALPDMHIIAEDLGYITESVKQLVKDSGYPNMKVLEFAFDSRDSSGTGLYLPHNYDKNCVVYTGTHDNETLAGWISGLPKEELDMVKAYLYTDSTHVGDLTWRLIRLAMSSTANYCIVPVQDYLVLGNAARINTPSTTGRNWRWRMSPDALSPELAASILRMTRIYGRQIIRDDETDEITEDGEPGAAADGNEPEPAAEDRESDD